MNNYAVGFEVGQNSVDPEIKSALNQLRVYYCDVSENVMHSSKAFSF